MPLEYELSDGAGSVAELKSCETQPSDLTQPNIAQFLKTITTIRHAPKTNHPGLHRLLLHKALSICGQ
ncbi:hypothetical protein AJ78_02513 [Emergomyces pasteurianus Ep9510]|uniref:Uncharacterized protein n=1 Tax=Emergomyces pasteurianus Ep9510 TaxID=1447872 RepID=A0A1J9QMJ5_9EURO|nr:hypothetical protein AJ78_02513 [Emergomyces pasteurianus Ep9510]